MFAGKRLDYAVIEKGLRELDPRFHFDVVTKHGGFHSYQDIRAGVWYGDRHISSIDRGVDLKGDYIGVPEFKQWESVWGWAEIPPSDADLYDMVSTPHLEVLPSDEDYEEATIKGARDEWPYAIIKRDGSRDVVVRRLHCRAWKERLGRVQYVGWRHLFENIVMKVPSVTRQALGEKFGVDMFKFPVGEPEEVLAALVAE